jgi:NAD(P)H-hydrate epimerase
MSTNTNDDLNREDFGVAYVPEEIDELVSNVKTVAFGMGIGTGDGASKILEHLIMKFSGTLIIDADGLTILSKTDKDIIGSSKARIVLTPHIKEFSRLSGLEISQILEDPTGHARSYAKECGVVLLLKGPSTIVTDGDRVYITDRGCAGMATAGSGDVLSGIIAAVCSYSEDKCLAAVAAAYINGAAGELAEERVGAVSMIAGDTVAAIPEVINNNIFKCV